ncbi:MAG TPA: ribbon-helix-helix protein, CopG family [Bryobacteraceae bacterium]|nr:ribbon-helix-helix protein, CopG family [Bryobacteraceae bacterium]
MVKVTFTLDEATVAKLADAAKRLSKPKSEVVREAVLDYHARIGRLSERERLRMLRVLDEYLAKAPTRSQAEVDRELREIRAARRTGGRRTPV